MSQDESPTIRHGNAAGSLQELAAGPHEDPDDSLGAVEGERPSDPQEGNPNGPGIDAEGRPDDPIATGEDRIGANLDETEG